MTDSAPNVDSRETLFLVDGHALVFQLFHAIAPMTAPDGRPTNIVFGFARDLFYIREEVKPSYLIYAFDRAEPTFRSALAPNYKAHRPPPPDDLLAQEPMIRQLLAAFRVPILDCAGYEADDVIATVATQAADLGMEVIICTTDKDIRQLIDDHVRMFNLRKRTYLDRRALHDDWGVHPEQVVDFQAMVGDPTDNVSGVKGIGEKTAAKLLQKFGSLDAIVQNRDQLDGVVSAKIQASLIDAIATGQLELSRKLVALDRAVPITFDWDQWRLSEPDRAQLHVLFKEWGFRSFAEKVKSPVKPAADLFASMDPPDDPAADFAFGANARTDDWTGDYQTIDTPKKFNSFLTELRRQKRFAFDMETTGLDPITCAIVGIAFCWKDGEAYYLPIRSPEGEAHLDEATALAKLKPIFENPQIAKVNQNIKFDLSVLKCYGIDVRGIAGDSMVADYLLRSGDRGHNLDELSERYFNHVPIPITDLIGKKGKSQLTMDQVPVAKITAYAAEDADLAWRLTNRLEADLPSNGVATIYQTLEIPLIDVLADMELAGIRLDVQLLQRLSKEMESELTGIEAEIHKLAGREFNIASPRQLAQVLFDEMKLPVKKKTDLTGAASTDQDTLEKLAATGHELPKKVVEYRHIAKLKGTYTDALPSLVNPRTGRIHTSFNQVVTTTGRLSSQDPNLQNIPVGSDQGRQIRQAFIPADGWVLLSADYSQIELRLLAHLSDDDALRQAFVEDRDIHTAVAAQIFALPENQINKDHRRVAKTVNFGVIYGMSAFGLADRLGIPQADAERFIQAYFGRYPKVLDYQSNLLTRCRREGFVHTVLGRRRRFAATAIRAHSTFKNRNQAEREAINMEIQGSAADLLKTAMVNIHRRLARERLRSRMLLTVHDELVFEVPLEELDPLATLVKHEMTTAMSLNVPLKVDVAAGPNWLDVMPMTLN